jgi:hydroxymethylglutaryl-CoA lyase
VVECPYEGRQDPAKVKDLTEKLLDLGSYQVSLGDTIGVATAQDIRLLMKTVTSSIKSSSLAVHFHDTFGQGLANVLASLDYGIEWVDASVNGLGGCPYAPGATGNVASEEIIYMLEKMNFLQDNINLDRLIEAGKFISDKIGRHSDSKLTTAWLAKKR